MGKREKKKSKRRRKNQGMEIMKKGEAKEKRGRE
jgi:hypothetical protein